MGLLPDAGADAVIAAHWVNTGQDWATKLDTAGRKFHECTTDLEHAEWELKVVEAKAYLSCDGKSEDIRKAQLTVQLAEKSDYPALRKKREDCAKALADARSDFSNAEVHLKLVNNILLIYRGLLGADER